MAVKKKNAVKEISPKEYEQLSKKYLEIFSAEAKARYEKIKKHFDKQTDDTQDAIERMANLLARIGHKQMWVKVDGKRIVVTLPAETIQHNSFYMACEILKDLAMFDIRVADYTFPTDVCASCGKPVIAKKAKKKGKK